ncbi:MAG: trigger factor [Solirubrobacterales bacterium]|nr:trigger factor [Solirubrobacterales bacterium]
MATTVTTTVQELPESRVRVEAQVDGAEVEKRLNEMAKQMGREMKLAGFRKGKVPPPVVIGRIGREAVLDEAIRSSLGSWYVEAIDSSGIVPVGDPNISLGDLPPAGDPLTFSIEIGVRPTAILGDYKKVKAGRREASVSEEAIDAEVDGLREQLARLETVQRSAELGDFVVIDYVGRHEGEVLEGAEGRDQVAELGAGRLLEGMDEVLIGASAGDTRDYEIALPDDHPDEAMRGKPVSFALTVKEVKFKELPEVSDEFASEAAGFDTLDELRGDIRGRLEEAQENQIAAEFREAAVDAAVENATVEVPEALIDGRSAELVEQLTQSLARQGISRELYLQISGRGEEELLVEARPDAERSLKREAVLAAVIAAEGENLMPSQEELLEALEHPAEHEKTTAAKLLDKLQKRGRLDALRTDLANRKAVDLITESAIAVAIEEPESAAADDSADAPKK